MKNILFAATLVLTPLAAFAETSVAPAAEATEDYSEHTALAPATEGAMVETSATKPAVSTEMKAEAPTEQQGDTDEEVADHGDHAKH